MDSEKKQKISVRSTSKSTALVRHFATDAYRILFARCQLPARRCRHGPRAPSRMLVVLCVIWPAGSALPDPPLQLALRGCLQMNAQHSPTADSLGQRLKRCGARRMGGRRRSLVSIPAVRAHAGRKSGRIEASETRPRSCFPALPALSTRLSLVLFLSAASPLHDLRDPHRFLLSSFGTRGLPNALRYPKSGRCQNLQR